MSLINSLEKLDLTTNEVQIYLYLVRQGIVLGPQIYKSVNLDKSSAYRALNSLITKGLVNSFGEKRNQKFSANDVNTLLELANQKQQQLSQAKDEISTFVKEIQDYAKTNYKQQNIQMFEGSEGYKRWLEARLAKPNVTIRELTTRRAMGVYFEDYYSFMDEHIKQRVSKGIRMHTLFDNTEENDHLDITSVELNKESRQIDYQLELDAVFSTYAGKTAFYSSANGHGMGIIITDNLITNLLTSMYDFIWSQAKVIY